METIAKVSKFIGGVNTLIGDTLDQILAINKFGEEFETFIKEYFHEHPDEIDNVYVQIKCSNPSFSVIMNRGNISCIKIGEKFFNDQEKFVDVIVKKRLRPGKMKLCIETV